MPAPKHACQIFTVSFNLGIDSSCHLTVFHAGRVMVVAEVDSPERWAFGLKVGAQVGLTDTASGYVLLAFRTRPDAAP